MNRQLKGSLALLTATIIWGFAFIAQSVGMDHMEPMGFQAMDYQPASLEELQESGLPELRNLELEESDDEDDTL